MNNLIFLKLGGSLITDKTRPYTPRLDSLKRLADEIAAAMAAEPALRLIVGHGSGSFGHYAATEALAPHPYPPHDAQGALDYWRGVSEVWYRASQLNRCVVEALREAHIPVMSFPASAGACAEGGKVKSWFLEPFDKALEAGLVPIVYGDIAFDSVKGSTILSTEMLLFHLAQRLHPETVLLAGLEAAVWADFPRRQQRIEKITAAGYDAISGHVGGSHGTDVTGGMRSKVEEMLELVSQIPKLTVQIFSGEEPGNLERALRGEVLGTLIASDEFSRKQDG
ncbi:MAG TPA: isopentenyl phosphate kinase [Anaerolineales bacterium]|nr:isopentenyl phosphate kinase [Anaerolineales bacterium]